MSVKKDDKKKKEISIKESIANLETQLALYSQDTAMVRKIKVIIERIKVMNKG